GLEPDIKMTENKEYRRSQRGEHNDDNRRSWGSILDEENETPFSRLATHPGRAPPQPRAAGLGSGSPQPRLGRMASDSVCPWTFEYESDSDSDVDRPDPDLVLDDLASRRFRSPSPMTPANYATPFTLLIYRVLSSSSWTSPPPTRKKPDVDSDTGNVPLGDPCEDSDENNDQEGHADPVQDDLYVRKLGVGPRPSQNIPYDKFLPKFMTPEESANRPKVVLGSQRRLWYRKMQGLRSKSMSDIIVDNPIQRHVRYEELQKMRNQLRDNEDQWQDVSEMTAKGLLKSTGHKFVDGLVNKDLSKWKSRRRSVNSDIMKKKEEREQIEMITGGGSTRRSKTFKEMQED
ncbi:hypothetical protein Z043_110400, partial [Scleropages formosus]